MRKSELLRALQTEIQRHSLSTFMNAEHKIVETGCPVCEKHFGTVEQFTRHISVATQGLKMVSTIDWNRAPILK